MFEQVLQAATAYRIDAKQPDGLVFGLPCSKPFEEEVELFQVQDADD